MSKVLQFFKYIIILFVCIVLLVSCIGAGIIMADKYKNQEYPFEDVAEVQSINSLPISARSTSTETNTEENQTGIENITLWGQAGNIEPKQELYFDWIQTGENKSIQGRAVIKTIKTLEAKKYNLKIAYIGNPLRIYNSGSEKGILLQGSNNTNGITINKNENGLSEFTGNYTIQTSTNNLYIDWFYNYNNQAPNGTYWINILLLQIYDSNNNYIINYESYLYEYLKSQFENSNNTSYEDGYNQGLEDTRANVFSSSTKISAYVEEDNHILTSPVEILPNGVGFSEIASEADTYMTKNEISDLKFTVSFQFEPFLFENNQIYISIAYGFRTLTLYDTDGNEYYMSWGDVKTDDGYAIFEANGNTIIGKTITKAVIGFQGPDYVGDLLTPDYLSYENYYDNGYSDGYKNGYDVGVGETIGSLTGWDAVKNGITSIFEALQIKVFGLFSLGDVIMICLVFAVVMFFLKVIRG